MENRARARVSGGRKCLDSKQQPGIKKKTVQGGQNRGRQQATPRGAGRTPWAAGTQRRQARLGLRQGPWPPDCPARRAAATLGPLTSGAFPRSTPKHQLRRGHGPHESSGNKHSSKKQEKLGAIKVQKGEVKRIRRKLVQWTPPRVR